MCLRACSIAVRILLAVTLMLAAMPSARAQLGGPAFEPRFTTKDLDRAMGLLAISDAERSSLTELHEAYLAEFAVSCQKMRTYMEQYQEAVNDQPASEHTWDEWRESWEKFEKHGDRLGEQFISDLKIALTPEQLERWSRVEQRMYRQKFYGRGWLTGERVDLVELVESLKVDHAVENRLDPILQRYETEFDSALRARQEFMDTKLEEAGKLWEARDMERLDAYYREGREVCLRVRDANLRTARLIAAELPTDLKDRFQAEFNLHAFGEIYAPTNGERLLTAARGLDDLSPQQREQVDEIAQRLEGGLRVVRERWATAQLKYETDRTIAQVMADEEGGENPFKDHQQAIEAVTGKVPDQLRGILSLEQVNKLPGMGRPKNLPKLEF